MWNSKFFLDCCDFGDNISDLANGVVKPTVSMGVVCTQRDATEFDIIYEKADEELYKAKREGKNCFKISE